MMQKRKLTDILYNKYLLFIFITMGLLFFISLTSASALDIKSASDWEVRGSAVFSATGAVIGDTIGYDSGDQDNDGNYDNSGRSNSKIDYDFIISKTIFAPPVTLEWAGCLPVTGYGYNMFGLGKLYNGGIFRKAVFQTRWEKQSAIQVWVNSGDSSYITGVSPSNGKFCASYKLVWDDKGIVTFYYNNNQVFQSAKPIVGPLVFFTRTFEQPATISSLSVNSSVDLSPVLEPCSTDPSSGQVPFEIIVTCQASGSGPLSWAWDWNGDGIPDETTQVDHATHKYYTTGTYKGIVIVTDSSGKQTQENFKIVALASDASDLQGTVSGKFTGTVQMPDGTTKQVTGGVNGSWNAKTDSGDNIAATAKGSFGADGISGAFDVSYDSATGQLTGSWGDIDGDILSRPISFTMGTGGGLRFTAQIKGIAPSSGGGMPFEGKVELELLGMPKTNIKGSVDGSFSTDITYTISGSVTYASLGQIPVNLSGTIPTSGQISGIWKASSAGNTFTGNASGQFSGNIDTSVSTPIGPYPIKIPYSGIWQVTLGTSSQGIDFQGNWVEPNIHAMGDAGGSFGGGFGIKFANNGSGAWPIPVSFTCPVSGGSYVDPNTGLQVQWKLENFNGNGHISLN